MESTDRPRAMRLGDVLIERGAITETQLNKGLEYQWSTGARLGEALVQLGFATSDQMAAALAWQGNYGLVSMVELAPSPGTMGLLAENFIRRRQVLPYQAGQRGCAHACDGQPHGCAHHR